MADPDKNPSLIFARFLFGSQGHVDGLITAAHKLKHFSLEPIRAAEQSIPDLGANLQARQRAVRNHSLHKQLITVDQLG